MEKVENELNENKIHVLCNLLHEFLKDCLHDPFENEPLVRRGRKRMYAQRIIDLLEK